MLFIITKLILASLLDYYECILISVNTFYVCFLCVYKIIYAEIDSKGMHEMAKPSYFRIHYIIS